MFVTVVDDVRSIKERLDAFPKWQGQGLQYDDILDWLDQETVVTEMLASIQRKPFYLIARKEDPRTFQNLILQPSLPKVYLSYAITGAPPDAIEAAQLLADKLRDNNVIVFDPMSIKDMQFLADQERASAGQTLPERVRRRIESATVYRDYRLISQSDMVVVYCPQDVYSHGVASEINYAAANSKLVVMIWPHKQSPFLKNQVDRIYATPEEFLDDVVSGSVLMKAIAGEKSLTAP
jgi:adenylate kinase